MSESDFKGVRRQVRHWFQSSRFCSRDATAPSCTGPGGQVSGMRPKVACRGLCLCCDLEATAPELPKLPAQLPDLGRRPGPGSSAGPEAASRLPRHLNAVYFETIKSCVTQLHEASNIIRPLESKERRPSMASCVREHCRHNFPAGAHHASSATHEPSPAARRKSEEPISCP